VIIKALNCKTNNHGDRCAILVHPEVQSGSAQPQRLSLSRAAFAISGQQFCDCQDSQVQRGLDGTTAVMRNGDGLALFAALVLLALISVDGRVVKDQQGWLCWDC
jgi:hypothetical protein